VANKSKSKAPKAKPRRNTSALIARAAAFKQAEIGLRLLSKPEVLAVSGCSFPTLWEMMRRGDFPRSRILGGRSMWLSTDIDKWLAKLPVRPLKGDAPSESEAA
jgi:predicted DNA-binding transcriptional regulator AlpA